MTTTAAKERPIIFSGEMVRAILDGRKTQTRRIVKPQPTGGDLIISCGYPQDGFIVGQLRDSENAWRNIVCPYGQIGDKIWVRETFRVSGRDGVDGFEGCIEFRADHSSRVFRDAEEYQLALAWWNTRTKEGWTSPIHMPRWASRTTLEITEVRVQLVQDISEDDAKAEGCEPSWTEKWWQGYRQLGDQLIHQTIPSETPPDWMIEPKPVNNDHLRRTAKQNFAVVWQIINNPDSWELNPFVWAISFRRADMDHRLLQPVGQDGRGT